MVGCVIGFRQVRLLHLRDHGLSSNVDFLLVAPPIGSDELEVLALVGAFALVSIVLLRLVGPVDLLIVLLLIVIALLGLRNGTFGLVLPLPLRLGFFGLLSWLGIFGLLGIVGRLVSFRLAVALPFGLFLILSGLSFGVLWVSSALNLVNLLNGGLLVTSNLLRLGRVDGNGLFLLRLGRHGKRLLLYRVCACRRVLTFLH